MGLIISCIKHLVLFHLIQELGIGATLSYLGSGSICLLAIAPVIGSYLQQHIKQILKYK